MRLLERMRSTGCLYGAAIMMSALTIVPTSAQEETARGERGIVISPSQDETGGTMTNAAPAQALEKILPPIPEKLPVGLCLVPVKSRFAK